MVARFGLYVAQKSILLLFKVRKIMIYYTLTGLSEIVMMMEFEIAMMMEKENRTSRTTTCGYRTQTRTRVYANTLLH